MPNSVHPVSNLKIPAEQLIEVLTDLHPELGIEGSEGKLIDGDALRTFLGERFIDGEKFGLDWAGKRGARTEAMAPARSRLQPVPSQSEQWDMTKNLLVEGDNLEALRLLRHELAGKVRLIYIDPPYNTGNDFVYRDDYRESGRRNRRPSPGRDRNGFRSSDDLASHARLHTTWLSMMYPRLLLARTMLEPSGVILISIGDDEVHHLRMLCDEVFGGENFCGTFVWEKKKKPSFLDQNMGKITEYILAYAKDRRLSPPFVAGAATHGKRYPFNNAGNPLKVLRFPARSVKFSCGDQVVRAQDMSSGNIETRLLDDVTIADGVNLDEFRLEGEWRYSQRKLDEFVAANAEIVISKVPFRPNYVNRSTRKKKTSNLLSYRVNGVPTNEDARVEMRRMFGADIMSYPKPTGLIEYLVRAITEPDSIVMDFFAGLGTTGHAVMAQNARDGGSRRFVLVQSPEPLDPGKKEQRVAAAFCDRLGRPRTIAELTKERLRRAAAMVRTAEPDKACDLGFRVFQLQTLDVGDEREPVEGASFPP